MPEWREGRIWVVLWTIPDGGPEPGRFMVSPYLNRAESDGGDTCNRTHDRPEVRARRHDNTLLRSSGTRLVLIPDVVR